MMPPRYLPHWPFPNYAFVPGQHPHPKKQPEAHGLSYPREEHFDPQNWRANQIYLFGVDLFNGAYFWEAHELWESLWRTTKKDDAETGLFFKALIQFGAAWLHLLTGNQRSFRHIGKRATQHFDTVTAAKGSPFLGIDLRTYNRAIADVLTTEPLSCDGFLPLWLQIQDDAHINRPLERVPLKNTPGFGT